MEIARRTVVALPHWFNPIAWLVVRRFDAAAEWACDRAATEQEAATVYARALLRLGEAARQARGVQPGCSIPPVGGAHPAVGERRRGRLAAEEGLFSARRRQGWPCWP